MFFNNLLSITWFNFSIKSIVRYNLHNRPCCTKSKTSGSNYLNIFIHACLFYLFFEILYNLSTFGSPATGTSAAQKRHFVICHDKLIFLFNSLVINWKYTVDQFSFYNIFVDDLHCFGSVYVSEHNRFFAG